MAPSDQPLQIALTTVDARDLSEAIKGALMMEHGKGDARNLAQIARLDALLETVNRLRAALYAGTPGTVVAVVLRKQAGTAGGASGHSAE